MLTYEQKQEIWQQVHRDFPADEMMQELHLIRGFMAALKKQGEGKSYGELSDLVRQEYAEWKKTLDPANSRRG
jgi:hypothetical protein